MLEDKLDRQMRLWGIDGQDALRTSSVIALGCTSTMTAALKSLILAGIGHALIVDEQTVTPRHISTNFFVHVTRVLETSEPTLVLESPLTSTKLLAEVVAQELRELNNACDVKIVSKHPEQYVKEDLPNVLSSTWNLSLLHYNNWERSHHLQEHQELHKENIRESSYKDNDYEDAHAYHRSRTVILVSNRYMDFTPCSELCKTCKKYNVDLICVDNCGMLGSLQIYGKDHIYMTELHNPEIAEMRNWNLFYPFDELRDFYNEYSIPSISLLYLTFREWTTETYSCKDILQNSGSERQQQKQQQQKEKLQKVLSEKERVELCDIYERLCREWCEQHEAHYSDCCNVTSANINNKYVRETIYKHTLVLKKPNILPHNVQELLSYDMCANPINAVNEFVCQSHASSEESAITMIDILRLDDVLVWYVLYGIKKFCELNCGNANIKEWSHQCLPFSGILPNITSLCDKSAIYSTNNVTENNDDEESECGRINAISRKIKEICESKHCRDVKCVVEISWHKLCDDWPFLEHHVTQHQQQTRLVAEMHELWNNVAFLTKRVVKTIYSMHIVPFHAFNHVSLSFITNIASWEKNLHDNFRKKWGEYATSVINNKRTSTFNVDYRSIIPLCFDVVIFARHELRRLQTTPCHECDLYRFVLELIGTDENMNNINNVENVSDYDTHTTCSETNVELEQRSVIDGQQHIYDSCYKVLRDCCHEVYRTWHTEFVPVSNILGALTAQESIKLIQRQRIPISAP